MQYREAIQFLYDLQLFGARFGLENTFQLAALAGNPQEKIRFIHVAGTNGKGSTCAMLESIYRAAGLRVGLFTSPHLVSFRERIQINRQLISESDVSRLVGEMQLLLKDFPAADHPTFFEVVTVIALKYFAEQKCDLVIWETGLGGRLDATNIVTPLASVITNVQLDHQQWLGETLAEIAREKAGIIKEKIPVISGAEEPDALKVISQIAAEKNSPLTIVTRADAMDDFQISLLGEHQKKNAALAVALARALRKKIPVSEETIRRGLQTMQWAGRLQLLERGEQKILLDGAHNPAGAQALAGALQKYFPAQKPALILGVMRDKDFSAMCKILAPLAAKIFLSPVGSERTADPKLLVQACGEANPTVPIFVCENLGDALAKAAVEKFIVVTGSLYFVGEALELLQLATGAAERGLNDWNAAPPAN